MRARIFGMFYSLKKFANKMKMSQCSSGPENAWRVIREKLFEVDL
jgi:hypothetical protein